MNEERDPLLQSLFADSAEELEGDRFNTDVLAQIIRLKRGERRRALFVWGSVGFGLIACAWWFAGYAQSAVYLLTGVLTTPLFGLPDPQLAELLFPLNSVAGLLGVCVVVAWLVSRRLFQRA